MPLCERVRDVNEYPLLCSVNGTHFFAINFSHETNISRDDNDPRDEEAYYRFARGIGMKGFAGTASSNFAHKLMNALPKKNDISKQDLSASLQ